MVLALPNREREGRAAAKPWPTDRNDDQDDGSDDGTDENWTPLLPLYPSRREANHRGRPGVGVMSARLTGVR